MTLALMVCLVAPAARASTPAPGAKPTKVRLLVQDLVAQGATPAEAAALTDAVVESLSRRGLFEVISTREVQAILGAERQRQILGVCAQDPQACASGLGEATGVRFVLSGALSRLGDSYQLSLQLLDTVKGQPVARSARIAPNLDVLQAQVPYAAAEATGSPLPPPASRVGQLALLTAGGAAFIAGGFIGLLALSRQSVLNDELCPGGAGAASCSGVNLRARAYYLEQDQILAGQKVAAVGLLAGGAALAALGLYLMPPPEGGPRLAVVPHSNGVALVGWFR